MSTCPAYNHCLDGLTGEGIPNISANLSATAVPVVRARQEDPTSCQKEVDRLDVVIRRLNEQRAHLLRTINNALAATRNLPPEVMSNIFLLARPPIDFKERKSMLKHPGERPPKFEKDDFQLALGAVCCRWRQIAWSTPQLWTTISVEVCEPNWENNASILNLYFHNTQNLPMTVELDLIAQSELLGEAEDDEERNKHLSSLEPICTTVLVDNAHKIQNLILVAPPPEWASSIDHRLSNCQKLSLSWLSKTSYLQDVLHGLSSLQALQEISFEHIFIPFTLHYSMITIIHLKNAPVSQCLDLLVKCPNLVEFENQHPSPDFGDAEVLPIQETVVLQNLEKLIWHSFSDEFGDAFLRYVRFAKLYRLDWNGSYDDDGDSFSEEPPADFLSYFLSFFSELSPTLCYLSINGFPMTYRVIHDLLCGIPPTVPITEFGILDISREVIELVMSMIGRPRHGLIRDPCKRLAVVDPNKQGGPKILASLQSLVWPSLEMDVNPRPNVVVDMLEALFEARGQDVPFRLQLSPEDVNGWDNPDIKKRVKRLMTCGFDLEVTFGSNKRLSSSSTSMEVGTIEYWSESESESEPDSL
ncbi:hypothetical protein AN958_09711 [Leucoagaricus sp. SymC.cos]|nr:hypothetical protein AN958_09711 [Leucoagaricus sp. SymC.cos]